MDVSTSMHVMMFGSSGLESVCLSKKGESVNRASARLANVYG